MNKILKGCLLTTLLTGMVGCTGGTEQSSDSSASIISSHSQMSDSPASVITASSRSAIASIAITSSSGAIHSSMGANSSAANSVSMAAPLSIPGLIEAEAFHFAMDSTPEQRFELSNCISAVDPSVDITPVGNGESGFCAVGFIAPAEYLGYLIEASMAGEYDFLLRVSSQETGKRIVIVVNSESVATVEAPAAGWDNYQDIWARNIHIPAGSGEIEFRFPDGGLNFNYVDIRPASVVVENPEQNLAKLFDDKGCNLCHANGERITDINALVDSNTLVKKIADTMPPNNAGACVAQCAQDLAKYMENLYYRAAVADIQKATVPVEAALRKAKLLLEGSAITNDELKAFKNDKSAIRAFIREWQQAPGYQEKMRWFLEENLQFARSVGSGGYTGQLRGNSAANPPTKFVNPKIYDNGLESAIRTIMELIVNQDQPFTNIATQTEWMLTPALMSLFLAIDYPNDASQLDFRIGVDMTDAEKNYSMAKKIETRRFYFPPPAGANGFTNQAGDVDTIMTRREVAFVWGALNQYSRQTRDKSHQVFKDSDYTAWKKVKIVRASANNPRQKFWDMPTLRNANTLYLESERVGFFTHPNFFNRWETNDDNQWRVTINQTLITALNKSFAPDDLSITLNGEVLSAEHAAPGTDCYACHRLVDPMRNYFRNGFDDTFGKPRTAAAKKAVKDTASFSFGGQTETGERLIDLGRALASHPSFASGWVQKLCYYSNSQACIESDEEFVRVADAFRDSNYNFNQLIVDFFSSELFLKDIEEKSAIAQPSFASMSRKQHICQVLSRRMSNVAGTRQRPCDAAQNAVATLADNIPADDWTRGALAPATPTRPDMFNYTTVENMCRAIALNNYGNAALPSKAIGAFLDDYFLPHILGITASDYRRGDIRKVLVDHYRSVKSKSGVTEKAALVSVFTLGCVSPLISSVDF